MASFSRSWNDDEDDNDDDVPFSWRNVRLARIRAAQLSPGLRASRPRLGAGMATRLVTSPLSRRSRRENREQFGDKCMLGEREGCGSFRSMAKVGQVDAADFPRYFLWSEWKGRKRKEEILCIFWKFSGSIVGSITIFLHVLRRGLYSNSCVEFNSNRII